MPVESNALEFSVNRAVENAARPENVGTEAQKYLEHKLDERPWNEKLSDEINAVASRLAVEGLGHSPDSMRVASNLNAEAVNRYHGDLLSRSKIPTEMWAVQAEVAQLDPRHPIMGRNQIVRNVAQSSGLWQERPDNIYFVDLDPNQKVHRNVPNPELVNLAGYWVPENTLKAVRDGMTVYHPFVEMERGVITLPVAGALVWNQAEQKFQPGFPAGATECFSMPYGKFKELSDELDNPKQNKAPARAAQPKAQAPVPTPPPSPALAEAASQPNPTSEAALPKNPAEVAAEFKNYIFHGGQLIRQGRHGEAMVYFKNKEELAKAGGYLGAARGRMLTHVPRPDEIVELANVVAQNSWYKDSGAILLPTLRMNDPSQMQAIPKELQHEVALVRMEEWLHRLQDLQGRPVAGQIDPEVDVAFYMAKNDIPMTDAFKQRYDRVEALNRAGLG